jgi:hypothetical protein
LASGTTLPIDYKTSGLSYDVNIDSLYIKNFVVGKRRISFVPKTNTLRISFSGINIAAKVNGAFKLLFFFPLYFDDLNIQDFSF